MAYIIEQELCSACHRCRTDCPVEAISFRNAKYWIDPEKCISCGKCVKVCHNGCISNPEEAAKEVEKHATIEKSCDVVVLGGGGAGLIAANKAQDLGCKVIVLEKMHEVGGSSWYAGGFRTHWSKLHPELGIADRRQELYDSYRKNCPDADPELLARMFDVNGQFADWMMDEHHILDDYDLAKGFMGPGPEAAMFKAKEPWYDASKRIDRMIGPGEIGSYMAEHMEEEFKANGGELLLKTSAKKLLTDDAGKVIGVLAEDEGGDLVIQAKAVIVATGAFSRNKEWMEKFAPKFFDDEGKEKIHIFTGAGATGDGLTMCDELGADIDYYNRRVNMFGPMRHPYPCASMAAYQSPDGFQIGSGGNLFHDSMGHEVSQLIDDPKRYGWKIMDRKMVETAMEEAMQEPPQSKEMDLPKFQANWEAVFEEEAKDNAIVIADTIEEFAQKLDIDADELKKNMEVYNATPFDFPPDMPDFMKPKHDKINFSEGPFYAIKMKMFHENAIGGMTIDKNASVLKNGTPIPGLYAAGDTTRGIMVAGDIGVDFVEGIFTSLTQAYDEGYIAGVEAANYAKA